jgi:Protein of unknown function DUF262
MSNGFNTDRATYTPHDFILWQSHGQLEITPKFQRRPVWKAPARSFFIDTILREMIAPPIYVRVIQSKDKTHVVREVIDGQQRIRAVLDYIEDEYRLSKTLKMPWGGKAFSELTDTERRTIKSFRFSVEMFPAIDDQQVLELFCRLNMNSIPLNSQELRNGRYFGSFKQLSYGLALEYLDFWRAHRIFTEYNIARMLEVMLTSELLVAAIDGMQDKKDSLDQFYAKLDDSFPGETKDARKFRETMDTISETLEDRISDSEFSRPPLFYTLYCVVYHHLFGMPNIQRQSPRRKLTAQSRSSLADAVIELSEVITSSKDKAGAVPKRYATFIAACQRQTDNIGPRKARFNALYDAAF